MLTVVTYCYAIGAYGSKAIALKISQDEILGPTHGRGAIAALMPLFTQL